MCDLKSYTGKKLQIKTTQLFHVGIWIHPSGCLGASPDGIITNGVAAEYVASHVHCSTETEPGVLEVKCPFSIKDTEDLITDVVNMKDAYIGTQNFQICKFTLFAVHMCAQDQCIN